MPLALTLVGAAFPPEKRGSAMGALQGLTGLAVASGPVIGGAVAEGLAWQWIFWINVPIGLLGDPARAGEDPRVARRRTARSTSPASSSSPAPRSGSSGASCAATAPAGAAPRWSASIAAGRRAADRVRRVGAPRARADAAAVQLFRDRAFSAANGASFLMIAALFSAVFFLAQFLQTVLGHGPLGAGLRLLPWTATLFFVAPVAGALVDRYGPRRFMGAGLALQAIGLLVGRAERTTATSAMIPALMVAGAGVSMALPATISAAVDAVPEHVGKAAGVNSTLRQLGGVFGIAIAVAVFAGAGGYASFADGFERALLVASGLSLAGALVRGGAAEPAQRRRARPRWRRARSRPEAPRRRRRRHPRGAAAPRGRRAAAGSARAARRPGARRGPPAARPRTRSPPPG